MTIVRIATDAAPQAIGPYSQAVSAGGLVFCSGQIALDPATGELAGSGVEEQTARALENLAAVLAAAGSGLDRVIKTTVYLLSMDDFAAMNSVYERLFAGHRPARAAVAVSGLPKGALVEIEAVALSR
jgi:2-iminobutanoate/2-iminopropanoate deaminase